jgi:carbon-monoxide dehydrogenase medium subunit
MIRTRLAYHAPEQAAEACSLLAEHGDDAAVLAGGTMLLPSMGRAERTHHHVVDLRRLGLSGVTETPELLEIGAMTTYSSVLGSELDGVAALVKLASSGITGGRQIRNQGTVGGSASYANPASDLPGVLVAAGAQLVLQGSSGTREVSADAYYADAFVTTRRPDEYLSVIRLARRPVRVGYYKLKLSESSWPIATGSAVVEIKNGQVASATVTLGGVCATPFTVDVAGLVDESGVLRGNDDELDELVNGCIGDLWDDELAPASYRKQVAGVVARRALQQTSQGGDR